MKIILFTQSFYTGGAEKISVNLANYYITQNYEVVIYVLINDGPLKKILNKKIKVFIINKSLIKSFFLIFNIVSITNNDIYIYCDRDISLLSLPIRFKAFLSLKKIRNIVREANLQNNANNINNIFFRSIYKLFIFILMGIHTDIIANSNDTKNSLLKNSFAKKNNIRIIPNPVIDNNMRFLKNISKKINFNLRRYDVIYIGRFTNQKNIKMLLKSLKILEDKNILLNVLFVGEGEQRFNIQEYSNLSNHLVAIKSPTEDVSQYLLESKVLVLPSSYEGFGNVVVEAMFFGVTPVVTNCKGAPKEIITYGKYGYLAENESEASFSDNILFALEKPISENDLFFKSSYYSVDNIAKKYIERK